GEKKKPCWPFCRNAGRSRETVRQPPPPCARSLRAGQGKRGSSAAPFPCTLSPAHWRLPKGESTRQNATPKPPLSRLISHWKQTPASGSARIGIKVQFQAHLRIGKCSTFSVPCPACRGMLAKSYCRRKLSDHL